MIKALIFDFDGLILDTELPAFQSWQEIYEEHGCSLPLSEWAIALGTTTSIFDACQYLEEQVGRPVDRAALRERRQQRKLELTLLQAALPGVLDYIADAQRLGLRLAVASSSSRGWVADHLLRLGIYDAFVCLACSDDVARVKPEPELYLAAMKCLGVGAEEAVALEDSPNGITAAKRAGLFCVAVPNALTGQLSIEHADLQLASLADLPLAELLEEVERARHLPLASSGGPGDWNVD